MENGFPFTDAWFEADIWRCYIAVALIAGIGIFTTLWVCWIYWCDSVEIFDNYKR